jgi:signal transduction histidine kinase
MREEERRRIRRDLHDGLGPALAGVALGLDAVHRMTGRSAPQAAELADQLKVEVHQSLADVRRLVEDLRPPDLDQLGLVGALRHQAGKVTERDPGLDVEVASVDLPHLPAAVEVAAYRIATEALTNVGRHASARSCRILLAMDDPADLRVEIEDDGVGLRNGRPDGVGLTAMRERAVELGGSLHVCRREQGGTLVTARIPVAGP